MQSLDAQLAGKRTVAIAGHVRPDGDCAGSCLATYNYIKTYYPQIKVDLYLEPIPNIFKYSEYFAIENVGYTHLYSSAISAVLEFGIKYWSSERNTIFFFISESS